MNININNDLLYLTVLPFGISLTISIILRFLKINIISKVGYSSPIISIIISYFIYFSLPEWPVNEKEIVFYIIIISAIISIIVDLLMKPDSLIRRVFIVAAPLLALVWISSNTNTEFINLFDISIFIITFIIYIIIGFTLADKDLDDQQTPLLISMFVIGVGILANSIGEKYMFYLSVIIFSSIIGFHLVNWPKKFYTNSNVLLGLSTPILSLAALLALNSKINPFSILLMAVIFFIEKIIIMPIGHSRSSKLIKTFIILISSSIIIIASISIQDNNFIEYIKI